MFLSGETGSITARNAKALQRDSTKARKKGTIMTSLLKKFRASGTLGIALVGLIAFLPACSYHKVAQIGSHKVTVSRHGLEKHFHVTEDASATKLEYAGLTTDGRGLKVFIQGDKVTVNGVVGGLRPGDSVLISDDGVAVNSLDYGESEKYLRVNNPAAEASVRN
jgi:hypothetical protein